LGTQRQPSVNVFSMLGDAVREKVEIKARFFDNKGFITTGRQLGVLIDAQVAIAILFAFIAVNGEKVDMGRAIQLFLQRRGVEPGMMAALHAGCHQMMGVEPFDGRGHGQVEADKEPRVGISGVVQVAPIHLQFVANLPGKDLVIFAKGGDDLLDQRQIILTIALGKKSRLSKPLLKSQP